ncbi:low affinity Fe/Cu permease [Peribacillus simplex]|nr:low affinity Fe/Cu permease [Peribacillus simplex]
MDTSSYIFLAIYWVGIIIWSLKNKEKAKKELLQIKNNWKTGVSILLIVLFPFLVMASMIFVL